MDQEKTPCPLCGALCSTSKKVAHLKHCSQRLQLEPQQLIAAAQLQKKHEEERKALGLPQIKTTAKQKREGNNRQQKGALKLFKEPKDKGEADLQMALAISASLQPVTESGTIHNKIGTAHSTVPKPFRKGTKKAKDCAAAPPLIMVSNEQRQQKIADRVARLLSSGAPQSETNTEGSYQSPGKCRLWKLSSQNEEEDCVEAFYVQGLLEPSQWSKPGSKLWHLSQIAGRKSFGDSTLNGLCCSLEAKLENNSSQEITTNLEIIEEGIEDVGSVTQGGFCTPISELCKKEKQNPVNNSDAVVELVKALSPKKRENSHAKDFLQLVGDATFSDATVVTADGEIPVHKIIIYARCPALLKENADCDIIDLSSFPLVTVIAFLQYIYAGTIDNVQDKLVLLQLARRFHLKHLESLMACEEHLQEFGMENLEKYLQEEENYLKNISESRKRLSKEGNADAKPFSSPSSSNHYVSVAPNPTSPNKIKNDCIIKLQGETTGGCTTLMKEHLNKYKFTGLRNHDNKGDIFSKGAAGRNRIQCIESELEHTVAYITGSKLTNTQSKNSNRTNNISCNNFEADDGTLENNTVTGDCDVSDTHNETLELFLKQLQTPVTSCSGDDGKQTIMSSSIERTSPKTQGTDKTISPYKGSKNVLTISSDSDEPETGLLKGSPVKAQLDSSGLFSSSPELFANNSEDELPDLDPGSPWRSAVETSHNQTLIKDQCSLSEESVHSPVIVSVSTVLCKETEPRPESLFLSSDSSDQKLNLSPEQVEHIENMSPGGAKSFSSLKDYVTEICSGNKNLGLRRSYSTSTFSECLPCSPKTIYSKHSPSLDLIQTRSPISRKVVPNSSPIEKLLCTPTSVQRANNAVICRTVKKSLFNDDKKKDEPHKTSEMLSLSQVSVSSSSSCGSPPLRSLSERLALKHGLLDSPDKAEKNVKNKRLKINTEVYNACGDSQKSKMDSLLDLPVWSDLEAPEIQPPKTQKSESAVLSLGDKHSTENQENHMKDFYVRKPSKAGRTQPSPKKVSEKQSTQQSVSQADKKQKLSRAKRVEALHQTSPSCSQKEHKSPERRAGSKRKENLTEPTASQLDFSPLPDYQAMFTPDLKTALKKFGIKGMPRKKAVTLLNHIYHQTHPGSQMVMQSQPSSSSNVGRKSPNKRISVSQPTVQTKEPRDVCSSLSSSAHSSPSKSTSSDGELEELMASQPITPEIKDALKAFILSNEEIHEKILFYEPISVPEFLGHLREAGLKPNLALLYNFFDEQGITFTNPREERKKRINKKKVKSQPKKKS